jgi:hypothetical protein
LPSKLDEIIGKMLEKHRDLRYQSAAEIRTDLKRLKRDTDSGRSPVTATVSERTEPTASTSRRKWKKWIPAVLALGLVMGLALLYSERGADCDSDEDDSLGAIHGLGDAAQPGLPGPGLNWLEGLLPSPKVLKYTQLTKDGRAKPSPPDYFAGLVTDGARLYFLEVAGGASALAQVSTSGGETTLVRTPFPNVAL